MTSRKFTKKRIIHLIIGGIILVALIVSFLCYIHEPDLTRDTKQKPDISFNGKGFELSAENCIRILNEDLAKKDLPLISEDYKEERYRNSVENEKGEQIDFEVIEYNCPISESLSLQLFVIPEFDNGIAVIQLRSQGTPTLQKSDNENGDAYYEVICNNIDPRFLAEKFDTHTSHNTHYTLDQLLFYCSFSSESIDEEPEHDLRIYGVHQKNLEDRYPIF